MTISFAGTDQGQPSQWSNTYVMVVRDSAARQMTLTGAESKYRAELSGTAYEERQGAGCTAGAIYEPGSLASRWEPAGFLSGVIGAVEAGAETVNAVAATHYTFDERAFGPLPPSHSTGNLWVASDSNYIARYQVTTSGTADYFGEGSEGTLTMDYQVTDVNTTLAIDLPADCPQDVVDAPLLPDALDVVRVPSLVSYMTAAAPDAVIAFYQQALAALGWQQTADPTVSQTQTFVNFIHGERQLSVIAALTDAGSSVQLIGAPNTASASPTPAPSGHLEIMIGSGADAYSRVLDGPEISCSYGLIESETWDLQYTSPDPNGPFLDLSIPPGGESSLLLFDGDTSFQIEKARVRGTLTAHVDDRGTEVGFDATGTTPDGRATTISATCAAITRP